MKNLSLKLKEDIYKDTERVVKKLNMPRNSYINKAIDFYNKVHNKSMLKKKLYDESMLVSEDSMEVLKEFEKIS
jgi:NAD+--asparagine ADP-ribosyltransferase